MLEGKGHFARQHKMMGFFARVYLKVDTDSINYYCTFECSGKGFYSQGDIEEVEATGYNDWKAGAEIGTKYALKVAQKEHYGVIITKIEGVGTDTNPTVVGTAAAFAVWDALNFKPSEEIIDKITQITLSSGSRDKWDQLPDF